MTDLMRSIRSLLDERSKQLGRPLPLSVRVPPTFELAMGSGLDVRTWIDEGIIDILIAGVVHTSMYRVPVGEIIEFLNEWLPDDPRVGDPFCTGESDEF